MRFFTDVNDNPPTLPQDNYEVTVSESAPFGSVILKVTAKDEDGPGESTLKRFFRIISGPFSSLLFYIFCVNFVSLLFTHTREKKSYKKHNVVGCFSA